MAKINSSIKDGVASNIDDSKYVAQNLIMKTNISMALQAIHNLGIPDILAAAEGRKPLSAEEILRQLPTKSTPGPNSVRNVQRLLSPLVREGVFSESLNGDEQPVYGLTSVSEWFIRGSPLSVAPIADLSFSSVAAATERCLHEAILDETTTAFIVANGVPAYDYVKLNPEDAVRFQKAMVAFSNISSSGSLESLLQSGVLDGVNTLVDVGGGRGHIVAEVIAHNPNIQGINFDLPAIIAAAPTMNGVQNVAGSFFEKVPSGDAMFLKWIIHNYGDEEAIQILKNCFTALPPKKGKVILAEFIKDKHDQSAQALYVEYLDLVMLKNFKGGRERSEAEYQALLVAAGFLRSNLVYTPGSMTLIEGFKE